MGLQVDLVTNYGEDKTLYVRLNSFESLTNHSVDDIALFRGYFSKDAFEAGKAYIWEKSICFTVDVTQPVWAQAYAALKAIPVQGLPPEPVAPTDPGTDATDAEKQTYELALAEYNTQHSEWETTTTRLEAENAEAISLAAGTEI